MGFRGPPAELCWKKSIDPAVPAGRRITIRRGSEAAVALDRTEPLHVEASHFLDCVRPGRRPLSDGRAGGGVRPGGRPGVARAGSRGGRRPAAGRFRAAGRRLGLDVARMTAALAPIWRVG